MAEIDQSLESPGVSRTSPIPDNARQNLSDTAMAGECFINQRFSNKLQAFLIGYVGSTAMTNRSVYE